MKRPATIVERFTGFTPMKGGTSVLQNKIDSVYKVCKLHRRSSSLIQVPKSKDFTVLDGVGLKLEANKQAKEKFNEFF